MMQTIQNKQKIRCAIYTRKSCEEGLEQEFNSLDAQRASAENYIASQLAQGWVLMEEQYNDGGYSGGNLERPALNRLFQDIKEDKIDIVVVYKIDRLTRSLFDFSKIIELFDEHKVSFVSVTQSFNTANSMGRLMLNVLLSFAQYERELTSERIKDKFEASSKQGIWMGGNIPLGYDAKDRKLLINQEEAIIIKALFNKFIETHSITDTARSLNKLGFKTKSWVSNKGKVTNGKEFNKQNVKRILQNPIYIGKIKHKDKLFDGQHEAIINEAIWTKAKLLLTTNNKVNLPTSRVTQAPILKGLMYCSSCGSKMIPTYTKKQGKRYRYYICYSHYKGNNDCKIGRISANEIEELVINQILEILKNPKIIIETIKAKNAEISDSKIINSFKTIDKIWDELFPVEQARIINLLVKQIEISVEGLNVKIYEEGLKSLSTELIN